MKIVTWNVNGIRAVMKKGFVDIMKSLDADVICLQETKAFSHQMPPEIGFLDYPNICRHAGQRPGYAGTAILSRLDFVGQCNVFEHSSKFHEDGRVTQVEIEDNIILLNIYFPNGGTRADGTEMLSYKLAFYDELAEYILGLKSQGKEVIVTGDFNICHTEIDIARPKENANTIGFLPVEREKIGRLMETCGLTDMFRHFYPDTVDEYTRWSYRAAARERNVGRRLDYFMLSEGMIDRVELIKHRQDIMGSDHCPVEIILKENRE